MPESHLEQELPSFRIKRRREGITLQDRGALVQASTTYRRYLQSFPDDAEIWARLGNVLAARACWAAAIACYRRAFLHSQPSASILVDLGQALWEMGRGREAIGCYRAALAKEPDNPDFNLYLALGLRRARDFEGALSLLDKAQQLQPENPRLNYERGITLLCLGKYEEGWLALESRHLLDGPRARQPYPLWRGESLSGKRILVVAESTLRENILCARFFGALKARGARVTLACRPQDENLLGLFGPDEVVAAGTDIVHGAFDFYSPILNLPGSLGVPATLIPPPVKPQSPDGGASAYGLLKRRGRLRVGVAWSGDGGKANSELLERLLQLAEVPSVQLYNLQTGAARRDLVSTGAESCMVDLAAGFADKADLVAAVSAMDLVVAVDGELAHIAASAGIETYVLLGEQPHWVYEMQFSRTNWYPAMRLFRSASQDGWVSTAEWGPVIEEIRQYIESRARSL
ncbi:tetratricopeptide repeat protein [Biformimicrobium ophioploci]|uniref:Tetratricopeptide repeat protein n=1 Tax=Biformimicrobium ophioploci TaxID=3036711 RepID=A0ABQ6LXX0_9GAMM|nr:tetratricopeptide repeat protein [Microbulbifer sp. NKW57]GMG86951.1 hypothetical protein MNKW57_12720 [Microbulbifer sp. NKW57]